MSIEKWAEKKCRPCRGGEKPLSEAEIKRFLLEIPGWNLSQDAKSLWREYLMKDFLSAVQLVETIAPVAEAEDHHPDLHLTNYRRLRVELSTHSIGGVSENDLILAAKIDRLPKALKP